MHTKLLINFLIWFLFCLLKLILLSILPEHIHTMICHILDLLTDPIANYIYNHLVKTHRHE